MEVCNGNRFNSLLRNKLDWDHVLYVFGIKKLELICIFVLKFSTAYVDLSRID